MTYGPTTLTRAGSRHRDVRTSTGAKLIWALEPLLDALQYREPYLDRLARNTTGLVGGDDSADQQSALSATVLLVEQMLAARVEFQVKFVVAVGDSAPSHRAGHLDARLYGFKAGGMMNTGERIAGAASTRHSRRLLDRIRAGRSGKDGAESNR